jgi:predicted NACHT family NTPase
MGDECRFFSASTKFTDNYLTPVDAKNISVRLPSYFVLALNEEWREHSDDYKSLLADETPFSPEVRQQLRQQQGWQKYQAYLQKKVDEPMFLESFGLRQVYVPLRAYFERKTEAEQEIEGHEKTKVERVVVDLETELRRWIEQADPTDGIRLISGGPGSGKSSFTKVLASNLSDSGTISVLYIPLHWFQMSDSLEKSIIEFVKREKYLAEFSLDLEDENLRLLIIFDGLDELSMQGKIAEKIAKDFENEVKNFVDRLNYSKIHIQVIISGRDVVIQSTQTQFNKSHQLLSLLPYVIAEKDLKKNNYVDAHQLLPQDQRNLWW